MRLIYVPEDRFLSIDGVANTNVAIPSDLPATLHALQIYEDGRIEPEWMTPVSGTEKLPTGFVGRLINIHNIYTESKAYVFEINDIINISYYRGEVPDGVPFISIGVEEVPDAPIEAWEVDFSNPDGIGGQL
jgi:hypothetical protein